MHRRGGLRPWQQATAYTRANVTPGEDKFYYKMNDIQDKFTAIVTTAQMILDQFKTARIPETSFLEREEMKTHLDIIESMLGPLYDYQHEDIWKRREKKSMHITIQKIRVRIYDDRTNFQPFCARYSTDPINLVYTRHRLDDICIAIMQTVTLVTDPEIDELHVDKSEMIKPLKQLTAFEIIFFKHPCFATHSDRFIQAKFAPVYIALAKLLKK